MERKKYTQPIWPRILNKSKVRNEEDWFMVCCVLGISIVQSTVSPSTCLPSIRTLTLITYPHDKSQTVLEARTNTHAVSHINTFSIRGYVQNRRARMISNRATKKRHDNCFI